MQAMGRYASTVVIFVATLYFLIDAIEAQVFLLAAVRTLPLGPVNTLIDQDGRVWMGKDLITMLDNNQELVVRKVSGALIFLVKVINGFSTDANLLDFTASV